MPRNSSYEHPERMYELEGRHREEIQHPTHERRQLLRDLRKVADIRDPQARERAERAMNESLYGRKRR